MNELYEVIQSYNEYLRKLPQGCHTIAALLKDNQVTAAKTNINNFSEGLVWLSEAQHLMTLNNIDHGLDFTQIDYFLEQINTHLENKELLKVAEIFETTLYNYFVNLPLISEA